MIKNQPKTSIPKSPSLTDDLQNQVAQLTEALQRERADAINVRRRSEEEKTAMGSFYKAMLVRELLPIIDNLDRAISNAPTQDKNGPESRELEWIHGVKKIYEQFEQTLKKIGVEKIKTVGEPFDPKFHEAVSMEDSDGAQEIVSEELQAGYKLGDEVLRHAMVKVKMGSVK